MRLLLATNNAKKLAELELLLAPLEIDVVAPAAVGGVPDVDEDRPDFAGNAAKKARSAALAKDMWALADDSGLEVEHLQGAPGVRSARYSGGGDRENNAKLLSEMQCVDRDHRRARFVCALALSDPDGEIVLQIEGTAAGRILEEPRGGEGFGYDPLFEFDEPELAESGRTFAELGAKEKSRVSHRGRALRELVRRMPQALGSEAR